MNVSLKELIDNNLRGNSEDETSEGDNQKDGGVNKVVIQKNTSKAAQSSVDFGCAHSEKKKTHGNKKINSVNASATPRKVKNDKYCICMDYSCVNCISAIFITYE